MGVDVYVLDFLLTYRGQDLGDTLFLGRQGVNLTDSDHVRQVLQQHNITVPLSDLKSEDGHAEPLLMYIGARTTQSLDISNFEGATIIHDMNDPIPDDLVEKFDCIIDGGTLEHIFNFPQAIDNVKKMLKIGGMFFSINGANNQLGHGFYQFSPELFWRIFGQDSGFVVRRMRLVPMSSTTKPIDLEDPAGQRQEIGPTPIAMYLMVAAQKMAAPRDGKQHIFQSDYAVAWKRSGAGPGPTPLADPDRKADQVTAGSEPLHPFMRKLFAHLGCDEGMLAEFARAASRSCETVGPNARADGLAHPSIPRLTHRIWLTADDVPAMPPEDYVGACLRANCELPTDTMHFFWSNSATVREQIQGWAAQAQCTNFVTMDVGLFQSDPLFSRIMKLVHDRKFVLAADVLKFLILHRFGGIYADLGVLFDSVAFELICTQDYALIGSDSSFFQTSFVAAAPKSDLTAIFRAVLNYPHALSPSYALLGAAVGALDEVHIFAGPGFTVCALLFVPPWARTGILPAQSDHMHWRSQQSWYGTETKHGNVIVGSTGPSILTNEQYREAEDTVEKGLQFFGNDQILRERLRILLLTASYFSENPTRFCTVFSGHGSDKALGWHNYGFLYNFILGPMRGTARRILEIGIGTNNLDVPSNMGRAGSPGASLRAWRELFPLATVIGADVDDRVLFRDDRIETYYVDQTRPETLEALFHQFGAPPFDLVVDDGLHTFEANVNVYRAAHRRVGPGGFLVIEDVRNEDVPRWAELLASVDHVSAIVQLPHPKNHTDNCLVLLPGMARP
jgi:SAM-dependent methyltransferase